MNKNEYMRMVYGMFELRKKKFKYLATKLLKH